MGGKTRAKVSLEDSREFGGNCKCACSVSDAQEYVQGHWDIGVVFDTSRGVLCMPA